MDRGTVFGRHSNRGLHVDVPLIADLRRDDQAGLRDVEQADEARPRCRGDVLPPSAEIRPAGASRINDGRYSCQDSCNIGVQARSCIQPAGAVRMDVYQAGRY
jgi:hypothetical protein